MKSKKSFSLTADLLNSSPQVALLLSREKQILFSNKQFKKLFLSTTCEDDNNLSDVFEKHDEEVFSYYLSQLKSKDSIVFDLPVKVRSKTRFIHWTAQKSLQEENEEEYFVTGTDLTECKATCSELDNLILNKSYVTILLDQNALIAKSIKKSQEYLIGKRAKKGESFYDAFVGPIRDHLADHQDKKIVDLLKAFEGSTKGFDLANKKFSETVFFPFAKNNKGAWLQLTFQPVKVKKEKDPMFLAIFEDQTDLFEAKKIEENAIKIQEKSNEIYMQAILDPVTSLGSRLHFEKFKETFDDQSDQTFSVILFDVDEFKKANDTYGHPFCDEVLGKLGQILLSEPLKNKPFRYGGEEFILILEENLKVSYELAERIRKKVEEYHFEKGGQKIQFTITGGVAERKKGEALKEVINRADYFLLKAKKTQKNQVLASRRRLREFF